MSDHKGVGDGSGRLICGCLVVGWAWSTHATVSASLLPAACSVQAGLAAVVGATLTEGRGKGGQTLRDQGLGAKAIAAKNDGS